MLNLLTNNDRIINIKAHFLHSVKIMPVSNVTFMTIFYLTVTGIFLFITSCGSNRSDTLSFMPQKEPQGKLLNPTEPKKRRQSNAYHVAKYGSEIINIDGHIGVLNPQTKCSTKKWGKNKISACKCCIVKNYLSRKEPKTNLDSCVSKTLCNQKLFSLISDRNFNIDPSLFISSILDNVVVTKDVTSNLTLKRELSEQDVIKLLKVAQKNNWLDTISPCRKITQVKVTSWFASQLFLIYESPDCSDKYKILYIFKGLKDPVREIKNLEIISQSSILKVPIHHLKITKPKLIGSYQADGQRYYFTLLEAAQGKSLRGMIIKAADVLANAGGNTNDPQFKENLKIIKHAYYLFGQVMADFHLAHKKIDCNDVMCDTVIHGDLHYENVFFDVHSNTIYLIDNESMADSIVIKADPANDLARFYYFSAAILDTSLRFPKNMPDKVLASITLEPFLKGYMARYPASQKKELKKKFKDVLIANAFYILVRHIAGKPQAYDPLVLSRLQKDYVKPIIDSL